ncbi:eukaryotic translation initiation factor 5B-like [Montipora foliosa]|uniref:eukaryotic translation initiation factor 5B-like n=1 Tax=Montipora foliosa TaxID=591990 RepID=UPI0035F18286
MPYSYTCRLFKNHSNQSLNQSMLWSINIAISCIESTSDALVTVLFARSRVSSVHNRRVTQFIVRELGRRSGFSQAAVEKSSKKYHEHIRRTALGKITDDTKKEKRDNLRKERKYERRRNFVKDEKESRAFASLTKHHMSTDDDDSASESEAGWVSRPPKYRSETLIAFLSKLDKRSKRAEQTTNKRWKRTTTRSGHPVEKEPPVNTPKWALSDEWKDELDERRRREGEMVQAVEEAERNEDEECDDEDLKSDQSVDESDLDFDDV